MYYHAGSGNHGCEAIVRSTKKIMQTDMSLFSSNKEEDSLYKIDEIVELKDDIENRLNRFSIKNLFAAVMHKIRKDDYYYTCISHNDFFKQAGKNDIYFSIGGDNYCYKGRDILGYYNKKLHQKGAKTVLWGCSFEPEDMTPDIAKDLALYDLIVTRESISYGVLKSVNPNTVLLPDPAFQLDVEQLPLSDGFVEGHTIGVNVSHLAKEYGDGNLVMDNYREMIRYIINELGENVALIPHVVKPGNDDRIVLQELFNEFKDTGKILLLDDYNCMQLKGFISRCRIFIGARTHATIAAYSTCVPTLVAGYSVKAVGIARELFGTDEHYVVPVQSFKDKYDLTKELKWLIKNENDIKNHLEQFIPEYKSKILNAKDLVDKL